MFRGKSYGVLNPCAGDLVGSVEKSKGRAIKTEVSLGEPDCGSDKLRVATFCVPNDSTDVSENAKGRACIDAMAGEVEAHFVNACQELSLVDELHGCVDIRKAFFVNIWGDFGGNGVFGGVEDVSQVGGDGEAAVERGRVGDVEGACIGGLLRAADCELAGAGDFVLEEDLAVAVGGAEDPAVLQGGGNGVDGGGVHVLDEIDGAVKFEAHGDAVVGTDVFDLEDGGETVLGEGEWGLASV